VFGKRTKEEQRNSLKESVEELDLVELATKLLDLERLLQWPFFREHYNVGYLERLMADRIGSDEIVGEDPSGMSKKSYSDHKARKAIAQLTFEDAKKLFDATEELMIWQPVNVIYNFSRLSLLIMEKVNPDMYESLMDMTDKILR
jgi:hypothetical protein